LVHSTNEINELKRFAHFETVFRTLNRLSTGMFSSKTLISFRLKKESKLSAIFFLSELVTYNFYRTLLRPSSEKAPVILYIAYITSRWRNWTT